MGRVHSKYSAEKLNFLTHQKFSMRQKNRRPILFSSWLYPCCCKDLNDTKVSLVFGAQYSFVRCINKSTQIHDIRHVQIDTNTRSLYHWCQNNNYHIPPYLRDTGAQYSVNQSIGIDHWSVLCIGLSFTWRKTVTILFSISCEFWSLSALNYLERWQTEHT